MAIGTTTSAMVMLRVLEKFGSMIQNRSRYRISIIQTASHTNFRISRLKGRDSSNANGMAKWNSTKKSPIDPQPLLRRFR